MLSEMQIFSSKNNFKKLLPHGQLIKASKLLVIEFFCFALSTVLKLVWIAPHQLPNVQSVKLVQRKNESYCRFLCIIWKNVCTCRI